MRSLTRTLVGAVATFLWLGGCATLVGIEDVTYDAAPPHSKACIEYCETVAKACKGDHELYSTNDACLGTCDKLAPGDDLEPIGNTVACRKKEAQLAITTSEPQAHCQAAGPGGAPSCGKNCESWCTLMQRTCPSDYRLMPDCMRACAALKDRGSFDLRVDHDGDTIQCRIEHVSNATGSPTAPATHCGHAALVPTLYCHSPQDKPPDCAEFCRFNMAGCTGDFAVYESTQQCLAVCAALEPGVNGHRVENTMGCRHWHTFNSLFEPAAHCAHTGPGGDGHCGLDEMDKTGNCVSYCVLAEKACSAAFLAKYGSQTACQLDCSTQPVAFGARKDSEYRLATAVSGNTLQCRILHASRALTDVTACLSALGQGACQ
jgi:hypothetical protein